MQIHSFLSWILNGGEWPTSFPSRFSVGKAARYAFVPGIYELGKENKVQWAEL